MDVIRDDPRAIALDELDIHVAIVHHHLEEVRRREPRGNASIVRHEPNPKPRVVP